MSGNLALPRKKSERQKRQDRLKRLEERLAANFRASAIKIDKWKRNTEPISKEKLSSFYLDKNKSMQEIADALGCSLHKVAYWMRKHKIKSRKRSDAMYIKYNPHGDPFLFKEPKDINEAKLFGLGLGLYWGEGTKATPNQVRLGNTDPKLIIKFVEFLTRFFGISKEDLRFGLQIFSDINPEEAVRFWTKALEINKAQIYKPIVTQSGKVGNYRKKSKYGVLTVLYNNTKLRALIGNLLPE